MQFTESEQKIIRKLSKFQQYFSGEVHYDDTMRILYATDASIYRILPLAVVFPKTNNDLKNIILFCKTNKTSLIPRTAGTSLGGQCVGRSIIVDMSKHLTQILEVNREEKWVRVQPGVVRDELNIFLKSYGLFFAANTSTSNRAMIGGMVGNNSSGSYSIRYGTTRENLISVRGYLSDGSEVEFGEMDTLEFRQKSHGTSLESSIYRQISFELNHPLTQTEIDVEFPKKSVSRRNTGYALDFLLNTAPFNRGYAPFNMAKMICGSEGTLMLVSEIKLHLHDLPTENNALICAHFDSLEKSLKGAVVAMTLFPNQCELMDKTILDCTKENITQNKNRFFIQGDPAAILMIEVEEKENSSLENQIEQMKSILMKENLTSNFAVLYGQDIQKAMQLRAAGLGVLQNIKSADRPLEFIEDTAVAIEDLPEYIHDLDKMIKSHDTDSVFYAHAGAGELHVRPKVNLKSAEGRKKLRNIAADSAQLVKKYQGSLSGEHGDGIVRGEFLPIAVGKRNYELMKRIKQTWDPYLIFNPNKIVFAPPMDENLREEYAEKKEIDTVFSFAKEGSFTLAAEKCSGSGDCRKTEIIGGTLCPSYQATHDEKHSTRARANILREFLTQQTETSELNQQEIYDVLEICLSCKACISECPSSVDMAAMKSEFLYQYHLTHPHRSISKNTAKFSEISKKISPFSLITNFFQNAPLIGHISKKIMGIDYRRSIPNYASISFEKWWKKFEKIQPKSENKIYIYIDEFTNYLDAHIAKSAVLLFNKLEIEVICLPFHDSSRSLISKGFLKEAKENVNKFIEDISHISKDDIPLIGIEPSAILGIRDDYHRLIDLDKKETLEIISKKTFVIEEYLAEMFRKNPALKSKFTTVKKEIIFHGHCHQKSLSNTSDSISILNFPENFTAKEIKSGCCGMAGSFGYEHYDMSMKIGNLTLFPSIRTRKNNELVAASGTSCRHQIKDGVGEKSWHPVEILFHSIIK